MRLMIKQRVFAWTDTYDIYDEWGNKKYFVKSEAFRLTHQVHVYDIAGNEIGLISQRLFTFLPTFDISVGGRPCGSIRKEFTFFKPSYSIEYGGWQCDGDFLSWNYPEEIRLTLRAISTFSQASLSGVFAARSRISSLGAAESCSFFSRLTKPSLL